MGFRFRKSKSFGPFRINVSKSGIGWSVGTKGARYTHRADGKKQTTLSIPGTGISYVDVQGNSKKSKVQHKDIQNASLNNINKHSKDSIPLCHRKWFIWIMLIFITPIGIPLLWLYSGYKKVPKIIFSLLFAFIFICAVISPNNTKHKNDKIAAASVESSSVSSGDSNENTDTYQSVPDQKENILTGWQKEDSGYYYYDKDGNKQNGWINDNGKRYYCDNSGKMQTGWLQLAGIWYFLNSDGSMAKDTTIDGYTISSDGIATKNSANDSTANNVSESSSKSSSTTTNEPAPNERIVYWTPNGKSYHYNKNCPTLKRSKTILSGTGKDCPKTDPCDKCAK